MPAAAAVIAIGLEIDALARPVDAADREAGAAGVILANFRLEEARG
jgi:hypothetical protein